MAINLTDNIRVGQQLPVDSRYFNGLLPWDSSAAVTTGIPAALRFRGLTVNILGVEYWWEDGILDGQLVIKTVDLPSTLDLYATSSPDPVIPNYTALVRNITDTRYNTTAVNIPTPLINGTLVSPTFCGAVISDSSILLGNPGVFNFTVIGNIRRAGGSTSSGADFFFTIYKRTLDGTETKIADSAPVPVPANGTTYIQYTSVALWNDGIFLSTDRVVLKFYGIKTGGGSGATYEFLFGGTDPVRGTASVSSAIIPNIYLKDIADVEKIPALNNEVLYWNDSASLWEHSLAEDLVPDAGAAQRGLISSGVQTIGGGKTFLSSISASNLSGTNTGDQDLSGLATKISPTFTGTVVLPSTTSIGNVSSTEIGYLDGVSQSIQTQFSGKQPLAANLTSLAGLTYSTSAFVKMTAAGTFTLDTSGGGGGGTITLSAIGTAATANANAATITGSVLNLEPASASFGGVITTGAQTIAGIKTFNSSPITPTQATGTNDTTVATTAFVTNSINTATPGTGYTVYNILIAQTSSITTQTTGTPVGGGAAYLQNGRNVMINNSATAIEINPAAAVDGFIASYTKIGTADITFSALTLPLAYVNALNGRVLSGLPGSTALLVKNGNNYYLSINNVVAT